MRKFKLSDIWSDWISSINMIGAGFTMQPTCHVKLKSESKTSGFNLTIQVKEFHFLQRSTFGTESLNINTLKKKCTASKISGQFYSSEFYFSRTKDQGNKRSTG